MSKIFSIRRHCIGTNGAGVTTLVGFWGCALRCRYCFNPACLDNYAPARDLTPQQLLEELMPDSPYFLMSGGGVTFGGGEPLLHSRFIEEFCRIAPKGWHIRIETSLNCGTALLDPLIPYVDQWIVDVKSLDPAVYQAYTTAPQNHVLQNLEYLLNRTDHDYGKFHIRLPHIPNFTRPDQVKAQAALLRCTPWTVEEFCYTIPEAPDEDPDESFSPWA